MTFSLSKNGEVVTVKMHWVRGNETVLNDPVNPGVGLVQDDGVGVDGAVWLSDRRKELQGWLIVCDIDGRRTLSTGDAGEVLSTTKSPCVNWWASIVADRVDVTTRKDCQRLLERGA